MINVSPTDFYRLHGGLVRMLRALESAETITGGEVDGSLSTRSVCKLVFNSRSYGWKILVQAEKLGYIKRKKKRKTDGPGHPWTMNQLTEKGHKLLHEMVGVVD